MIELKDNVFFLGTDNTSYIFRITKYNHLESVHYGDLIPPDNIDSLLLKHTASIGSSIAYNSGDEKYCLDTLTLEYSGIGKGDYRHSPVEIRMPDSSFVCDFTYIDHRILDGYKASETLPTAYGETSDCQTLEIKLEDKANSVSLFMYYTVFPATDVITRRVILKNNNTNSLHIRKLMSFMLDLNIPGPVMLTLDGGWIKEANKHVRQLSYGLYVNESTTGSSSNRHNPGIILHGKETSENYGNAYGFNLVYSGNHYEAVEMNNHDLIRIMSGINPHCFDWTLEKDEFLETPEAVMTFSAKGLNGVSGHFHNFINNHIVRGDFKGKERPVLINNWEAHFFKFTQRKLLRLARRAKSLGIELFVLDDGWFGQRNNDRAGLGDYNVNRRKFPRGLSSFAGKLDKMGLSFGLWFEPEMVNEDSDLYRRHPEFAIKLPQRSPSYGRNQLVLDLCNPQVRDYIVANVRDVLESANISYVKWDMNRHISDMFSPVLPHQGMFFHRYILGLYDILTRIFSDKPQILLESCASGGNRFDLGMLCFSPQIWASDDTDPIERLKIQTGLSYFYPLSCIGAHVSGAPHQQTLRATSLATRFNMACFGNLGYELDLKYLSPAEKNEVKKQIAFYKEHRKVLQFGKLYRFDRTKDNKQNLLCVSADRTKAIAGHFQTMATASESNDILPVTGLNPSLKYTLQTFGQGLSIKRFGALINHILPFKVHPEGLLVRIADKYYRLPDCQEFYVASGSALHAGVRLNNQFMGTWYNNQTRLPGDFGSYLYLIEEKT